MASGWNGFMDSRNKLIAATITVLAIIAGLIFANHQTAMRVGNIHAANRTHVLPVMQALNAMHVGVLRVVASVNESLVLSASRSGGKQAAEMEEDEMANEGLAVFERAFDKLKPHAAQASRHHPHFAGARFEKIGEEYAELRGTARKLLDVADRGFDPEIVGKLKAVFEFQERRLLGSIQTLLAAEHSNAERLIATAATAVEGMEIQAVILGLIAIVVLAVYSWFILRVLTRESDARKAAETANRSKSEFLATMSHEIRTPMTGVMGFADILLENDNLDADNKIKVHGIKNATDGLLRIINDILDISKLEAGKMEIEGIDFHLPSMVREVVAMFEGSGSRNRRFSVGFDAGFPDAVKADPTRLRQILVNLIGNAAKFTPKGSIDVQGSVERGADGRSLLRFTVRDTGIGMAPETMSRLFSEFTQADASVSRDFEGTGLGLAICKRLVELMSGEIGVESRLGEGSTFWFTLPYVAATSEAREITRAAPTRAAVKPATRSLDILVAEDNVVNRTIIAKTLEAFGHGFEFAENGEEVIDTYRQRGADLILMDIRMPKMSGTEATRLIREMPGALGQVPIVALTADALPENQLGYLAAGMNAVATKPIDRRQLAATINLAMGEDIHDLAAAEAETAPATEPENPAADAAVTAFLTGVGNLDRIDER